MRRWPPIIWPIMSLSSLLILMGLSQWEWDALGLGIAGAVGVFAIALYLATRAWDDKPKPRWFGLAIGGVAAFYAICAAAAAVADPTYAVIALLAGLIPASALLLLIATMRAMTEGDEEHRVDRTGEAIEQPPGIGMDDETPLGDTPEHSDAERVARPERRRPEQRRSRSS
jgi:hypothetical protein